MTDDIQKALEFFDNQFSRVRSSLILESERHEAMKHLAVLKAAAEQTQFNKMFADKLGELGTIDRLIEEYSAHKMKVRELEQIVVAKDEEIARLTAEHHSTKLLVSHDHCEKQLADALTEVKRMKTLKVEYCGCDIEEETVDVGVGNITRIIGINRDKCSYSKALTEVERLKKYSTYLSLKRGTK